MTVAMDCMFKENSQTIRRSQTGCEREGDSGCLSVRKRLMARKRFLSEFNRGDEVLPLSGG